MRLSIQRAGTAANSPPWDASAEAWRDHEGMIYAYGQVLGNEHWLHMPGLASFRFSSFGEDTAAAVVTSEEPDEIVLETFHRRVLPMAIQVRGREVLHASAIRAPAGVVSFCGVTRSGKSTIAFSLAQRGYTLWADDMVAFEFSDRVATSVSLPFTARLRRPAANVLAANRGGLNIPRYAAAAPGTYKVPVAIVCILRQDATAASAVGIRRLSSTEALAKVLDHACCFLPQSDNRKRLMLRHYLELIAVTPIFEVCFQPGLRNLPLILDSIEQLLASTVD